MDKRIDDTIFKGEYDKNCSKICAVKKVMLFMSFLFYLPSVCFSQVNSFQLKLDSIGHRVIDIAVNEEDEFVLFTKKYPISNLDGINIIPVHPMIQNAQGFEIKIPAYILSHTEYIDKKVVFAGCCASYDMPSSPPMIKSFISSIDINNGAKWYKYFNNRARPPKFGTDEFGNIYLANAPNKDFDDYYYNSHSSVFELFKLDSLGNEVWKKGILFLDTLSAEFPDVDIAGMTIDANSNIYVTGSCGTFSSSSSQGNYPYLIKFDAMGTPLALKTIVSTRKRFNEMQMVSDGILLLSHSPNNPDQYGTGIYRDERTTLIKLDFDLNFVWGKQYYGEHFPYYSAGIKQKPNGNLLMSHSTFGAYPAVLTELDEFGNVLSQKGYPNYQPQVAVLKDGSMLMTSKFSYDDNGQTFYQPVIAKTDTNGVIEGCVNYSSCILSEDFVVEFGTFNYDTVSIPELEGFDTLVIPVNFSFSEFCGFPPFPLPDFDFPDTLCLGKSGGTSNTKNILANAREWHLVGSGVDSVLTDSLNFSYTFDVAGDYILAQTVWVLGCSYEFSRSITILAPLEVSFPGDTLICPGVPLTIRAEADRPATFLWSNGQSGPSIGIATSGTYAVTATDGHCPGSGSTAITIVAELLGGQPPFTLPHDTATCLPLILVPQSVFTSQFYTSTDPTPAASFTLDKAGSYHIGATVFGCEFWETFEYGLDCHVDVYLPTSFSPNGDGINDEFMPYGDNFEVLELRVYDRWGGLIHQGKEWDGGRANQGLYVYELSYLNLRSGLKETQNGEVQLVR